MLLCFLCMSAMSLQLCPTLCDATDCSLPGSSVHGILQARILECVAMPFDPGIKPTSPIAPALQADYLLLSHWGSSAELLLHGKMSHPFRYLHSLPSGFPSIQVTSTLSRVPCAVQYVPSGCLLYTRYQYCICVNPNLPIPSHLFPLKGPGSWNR